MSYVGQTAHTVFACCLVELVDALIRDTREIGSTKHLKSFKQWISSFSCNIENVCLIPTGHFAETVTTTKLRTYHVTCLEDFAHLKSCKYEQAYINIIDGISSNYKLYIIYL